jgi:DNA repair protein RadD
MIELLKRINKTDLYYAISDKIGTLEELLEGESVAISSIDIEKLAKYTLAIYGYELLYESKIRHLIFTLIEQPKLKYYAEKYAKKSYEKPYDNALSLSLCSWRSGTEFVIQMARELNIPKEYLPLKSNSNQAVELVEPTSRLSKLHNYQKDLKNKVIAELEKGTERFLIQMPTGAGKTRTIVESLIVLAIDRELFRRQRSIVWLAHTEELCEQAIDTFKDVWQNIAAESIQIVRCWGTFNPTPFDVIGSFVVGTFGKFYNYLNGKSEVYIAVENSCKILIVDEAHKSIAPTFAKVIDRLCKIENLTLIGLTATPGRGKDKEKENRALSAFFHRNLISPKFSNNPISELRDRNVLSKIKRRIISTNINVEFKPKDNYSSDKHIDLPNVIIHRLGKNVQRNRIILETISIELESGNPCLVFSCSIEHSKILSSALNFKGYHSAHIDCNLRKGSRQRVVNGFRKGEYDVLFNYGVLSTGFDAPRIRTIIITRPTSSVVLYSQMIGRGLRGPRMGGSDFCNLIDIKDNYLNFGGVEAVYNFFEDYWD